MSVRSPSKASERHTAVVAAKEELLSEIQHWLKSSGRCIAEIRESLTTLRNAQALVKRDIHMARATVEIKLKVRMRIKYPIAKSHIENNSRVALVKKRKL